jgi:hypothetical protein
MSTYYAQITISDSNKHLCPTLIKLPMHVALQIVEINNINSHSNVLQLELKYYNTIIMHNIKQHMQSFQFAYDINQFGKFIFRDTKLSTVLNDYIDIFLFLHNISRDNIHIKYEKNINKSNIIASFYVENYKYHHQMHEKKYEHFI